MKINNVDILVYQGSCPSCSQPGPIPEVVTGSLLQRCPNCTLTFMMPGSVYGQQLYNKVGNSPGWDKIPSDVKAFWASQFNLEYLKAKTSVK